MKIIYYNSGKKHQKSVVHAVREPGSRFYVDTLCGLAFRNAYPTETSHQEDVTCGRCKRSLARIDRVE
jgi:hypothetical protein